MHIAIVQKKQVAQVFTATVTTAFWVICLCIFESGCTSPQPRPLDASLIGSRYELVGLLGYRLGTVVEIEGEFAPQSAMWLRAGYSLFLSVRRINGHQLETPILIGLGDDRSRGGIQKIGTPFHFRAIEWGLLGVRTFELANLDMKSSSRKREVKEEQIGDTVLDQRFVTYVEIREYLPIDSVLDKTPNKALVPTPASVTPAAGAPVAPDAGAAHL